MFYHIWQNKSNKFISNFSDLFFVFTMSEKTSVPPRSSRNPQVCLCVHVFTQMLLAPLAMIALKTTNVDCISRLANVRWDRDCKKNKSNFYGYIGKFWINLLLLFCQIRYSWKIQRGIIVLHLHVHDTKIIAMFFAGLQSRSIIVFIVVGLMFRLTWNATCGFANMHHIVSNQLWFWIFLRRFHYRTKWVVSR